jgi:two-component system, NtrC family, nitrogen regulation sensor histidine kinase GlnL
MRPAVRMLRFPALAAEGSTARDLDLLATAVLLLDDRGRITYANPAAENLFELSRVKFLHHALNEVFGACTALADAVQRARSSGASYTEQELELGVSGKPKLHLTCTVSAIDTADAALLLEFRHIDQQLKIAREERLQEQQQANRELIRSLAHEIKNPLGGIRGAAQLLERELDRPQLVEYTQVIIGEADRLRALVNRLLAPHRAPSYRRINIHEVLVRVKGVVQAEFPAIPIVCDFDTSLPEFEADHEQLLQAALNIVRNAAQALSGSPTASPQIRLVTRVARGVTLARRHHRLALAIAVEDNGPGVPEHLRDRIFFPLVSGREGGSGLGLTIAQTFITQHGGTIECARSNGRTIFTILLPMTTERSAPESRK